MQRRAELVLFVRTIGYGAIAISLIVTGAAGLIDGNTAGIAALAAGGIAGAMSALFGHVLLTLRREPFPLRPSWTPGFGTFGRVRSVFLGISASVAGTVGLVALVFGVIELIRGWEFAGSTDAGIFFLAVGAMAGTTAWARWPRAERDNPR